MRRGWLGVFLRFGALALVVLGIGLHVISEQKERREMLKQVPFFTAQIRSEGWGDDRLLGKQYQVFYPGTKGRLPLDCREIAELYDAIGCKPAEWESMNGGCALWFRDKPERTILRIAISKVKATVVVAGPVQPADTGRMTEALLNLAWDGGVRAKGMSDIKQTTSPLLWEAEFIFE